MIDVVVLGSANLDLVAVTSRHPKPGETVLGNSYREHAGGKGLNQAVAAARCGARVAFVGAVGDDEAGRRLIAVASDEGIDTSDVAIVKEPTGRAVIVVDDRGENSIVVIPGANDRVSGERLPKSRVVVTQLEIPVASVETAFAEARRRGAITILNPAPSQELPPSLVALCDVIIPNEHEAESLGGTDELLSAGATTVIVTRGAAGVTIHQSDNAAIEIAAPSVEVVDTTGAGDAFCGNFAARLAAGDDIEAAAKWATVAGALAVTAAGAVPSLPLRSAVDAFLTASE